ncbi:PTS beta-glucoside transporter subunit IIBCA [Streptococcus dysgalactiae subsp. dysgalactiae]|uniref:PTS system sucrose-specific EIIBCA component n=2 Tax=Streptococcus dysgalactiae subsp. equisimilis TaxID=119602 RepID=A0A9X8XII1_STREQ|nr:sucrose-specific PTS transporter subunit IIBC [Streptococcus dysgalactiae]EGR88486.1 PTS system sucrose-specific IIBC component [Streptococcus dysgalactiae subsp. equisimilis SK1250]BAN94304.1 PTS system sucrose-specific transporter subunit IIABC [Streptococcus dysgalactiae subsp. equisimilis 167]KKC18999.1 PTS sucrose transporter subunit IIABC [Streptococcus dysgalactiae subsp. equisimilis]KKC21681.1 PTS sucrose transporter subunit IIABC [Streptococcus dysgalactiae subsp. equisimilis]KKC23
MDNRQIATEVIEALGGRENVRSVAHCATRLRVMVHDEGKIDKEKAEAIDKVKGAFFNSGQYQMIFGTGTVNKIYDEVVALGLPTSSTSEQKAEAAKQGNVFQRAIRTFGDVFVPIIPAIVATGLFMGVRGLVTQPAIMDLFGVHEYGENFLMYTRILTDTAFVYLPALVAWSAFRVFGGNPIIGIVLGLMLVSNELPNAWVVASGGDVKPLTFFGFVPVVGYQGTVLPAFFVGLVGAKLEKWLHKRVPEALDLLVTPFLTFAIMSALGLFVIGPVFHSLENLVLAGTQAVLHLPFGIAGLIVGGIQQLIVVTGIHHIFNFLEAQLIANTGKDPFNAYLTAATAAQAGATLAVAVKTKSTKLKGLAFPSTLSALLGITEPAIFGVNLRYPKVFVSGLIGGALGGWVAGLFGIAGTGFGITVLPGTLLYLNGQLLQYLVTMLVGLGVAFAIAYTWGYQDRETLPLPAVEVDQTADQPALAEETLYSPLNGTVVDLSAVSDPVFSSGAMGQGLAIKPEDNTLYSPVDGKVEIVFETGHAYAITSTQGAEILLHIGIDTVSMAGDGFASLVTAGQMVKKGDLLGQFDSTKIAQAGLDDTTMIIVTNSNDYHNINLLAQGKVAVGDQLAIVR